MLKEPKENQQESGAVVDERTEESTADLFLVDDLGNSFDRSELTFERGSQLQHANKGIVPITINGGIPQEETSTSDTRLLSMNVLPFREPNEIARDTKRILDICYGNAKSLLEERSMALIGVDLRLLERETGENEEKKADTGGKNEKRKKTSRDLKRKGVKIRKRKSVPVSVPSNATRDAKGKIVRKQRKLRGRHRVVKKDLIKNGRDVKIDLPTISEALDDDNDDDGDNDNDDDDDDDNECGSYNVKFSTIVDFSEDGQETNMSCQEIVDESPSAFKRLRDGDKGDGVNDDDEDNFSKCTVLEENSNQNPNDPILDIRRDEDQVLSTNDSVSGVRSGDEQVFHEIVELENSTIISDDDIELDQTSSVDSTECTSTADDDEVENSLFLCGSYRTYILCGMLVVLVIAAITTLGFYIASLYVNKNPIDESPHSIDVRYPSLRPSVSPTLNLLPTISTTTRTIFPSNASNGPSTLPTSLPSGGPSIPVTWLPIISTATHTQSPYNEPSIISSSLSPSLIVKHSYTPTETPTMEQVSRFDYLVTLLSLYIDVTTPSISQISALVWMSSEDPMDWSSISDEEVIERYALVQIYYSLSGENWSNTNEWLSEFHACTWYGVGCSVKRVVTDLMLDNNRLVGPLPNDLFLLTNLILISFDTNSLNGTFPTSINKLKELSKLFMQSNFLTGFLPSNLGSLTHLTNVDLRSNNFNGPIPQEIYSLDHLETLALSSNDLEGTLSGKIGKLTMLTNLNLQNDLLYGTLPTQLGRLTSLTNLVLAFNDFSGNIISELGLLTNLSLLDISSNQLTGTLPPELICLNKTVIDYYGNDIIN